MSCPHCKHKNIITVDEFKEQFKVGDIVTGWSTDKAVQITAIGEYRFLYVDHKRFKSNGEYGKESTASCYGRWRLAK